MTKFQRKNKARNKTILAYASTGLTKLEIARRMNLSQGRVCRIIKTAKSKTRVVKKVEPVVEPRKFTVKVDVPDTDIGAMLTYLAQRNCQFTVSA